MIFHNIDPTRWYSRPCSREVTRSRGNSSKEADVENLYTSVPSRQVSIDNSPVESSNSQRILRVFLSDDMGLSVM